MIYYLANIVWDDEDIEERDPKIFEAAKQRVQHIASSLKDDVIIISEGEGSKKGVFNQYNYYKNNNINIKYLKLRNYSIINRLSSIYYLSKELTTNLKQQDKVICYNAGVVQVICLLILRAKGYKNEIIIEFEEFYRRQNSYFKNYVFKMSEYMAINIANKFVVTNNNMLEVIRNLEKNKKKPVLTSFGYLNKHLNIEEYLNEKIIYYGGRMDYEGGIDIFIKSLKYINLKCKVVITGGYNEKYISMLKEIDNENINIDYLGFVNSKILNKILGNQCICINPIRSHYEFAKYSFPSKLMQYLQSGNIIISSEIDAIEQLGELKKYVTCFKNDDSKELGLLIEEKLKSNYIDKAEIITKTFKFLNDDKNRLGKFIEMQ